MRKGDFMKNEGMTGNTDEHDHEELVIAAEKGDLKLVRCLVEQRGVDVNSVDRDGSTALIKSAENGHFDVARYLGELPHVDVNAMNTSRITALTVAAQNGYIELVRYFAEELDVNGFLKNIALIKAAGNGQIEVVRYLVEQLNISGRVNKTELVKAAQKEHFDVLKYLVECADTALMKAAEIGNVEMVQYLIENTDADINAENYLKKTALILAADNGHLSVVQFHIEVGAYLTDTMKAVFLKDVDIERYIVEHGMDVNATDFYRNTTLMWAARIGNNDIVRYLATEGAPLNVVNADGATAVMLAAERGHTETVKLLVEYGADVNFTTDGKDTALMKAKRNNHADVVHFLVVDACTKVTGNFGDIVLMAAGNGCIDIIQYIVENGLVDVNVTDKNRETALMKAAGNNHIDIVRYLIEHEAEVNAVNDWGCTALMLAARWEQLELVRCIAEHPRADVNIHDFYGGTALMKAALNGHSKVVRYLAGERGADANAADISGDTALMLAAERGHTEVVQYLADDYGANVNTKNNDGITALMWAAERGYLGIVQCLAKHCGDVMNTMDDEGHTALMKAVTSEQVDVVQYLIYQGNVDVNAINDWGETAYRLAYIRGYQDIRQILTPFLSSSPAPFTYDGGKKKKRISSQQIPGLVPPSEVALIALCQEGHIGGEYRAKWLDADVVVKLYIPDTSYSSFEEESRLWQKLRHPNVMKIYGACYAGPHLQFFVCEHTNNGSLLEYLKRLAKIGGNDVERVEYLSSVTLKFMHEAVLGLEYLHERGIVHGDLRCNNILIGGDGLAKLSNFSLCSSMDKSNQFSTKIVESIRWQSPEVMKGEQPSFASDVYSLGMCILEAMTILYEESSEWVMKFKTNWDPKAYLEQCTPPGVLWQMCCWKTSDRPSLSSVVYELEQLSLRQNVDLHERDSDNSISIDEYKQGKLVEVWLGLQRAMVNCKSEQHRWIFNELTKVHNILKSSAHPTLFANFYALLTDFYQIIKMSPEQARIVRLSSTRATTTSFYALRWRIESLLKILKGSTHNTNEIQERWSDQIMFFVSGMSDTYLLLKELKSVEERSAFLNLLETEIGNAHLKYTPDQLEVMKTTYETIASTIDANDRSFIIPEWFIPWYELIIDTYNKLGEGGFGSVYQAKWLDSDVVVKQIFVIGDDKHFPDNSFYSSLSASLNPLSAPLDETKRGEALAMFRREVDIWFALNHPHVIRLFGACHIGRPFFVCEYATNGTMITYLKNNSDQLWRILHEAALGVQYLHARGIIHGDLKGNNIVIGSDKKAKVTDFGLSSIAMSDDAKVQISAALHWVAPECFPDTDANAHEQAKTRPTFASDIYSLGMCIVEALRVVENVDGKHTGVCLPRGDRDIAAVRFHARKGTLPSKPSNCTEEQWNLVERMCVLKPKERIKISTVVDELAKLVESSQDVDLSRSSTALSRKFNSVPNIIARSQVLLDGLVNAEQHCKLESSLYFSLWYHLERVRGQIDNNRSTKCMAIYCSLVDAACEATLNLQNANESLTCLTETTMRCYALERRLEKFCEAYFLGYERVIVRKRLKACHFRMKSIP